MEVPIYHLLHHSNLLVFFALKSEIFNFPLSSQPSGFWSFGSGTSVGWVSSHSSGFLSFGSSISLCSTQFFEPFNKDPFQNGWVNSEAEKYKGKFSWDESSVLVGIPHDKGLKITEEARYYGLTKLVNIDTSSNEDLIIQYEVKLQVDSYSCGGLYMKLLEFSKDFKQTEFTDKTPYVIMFGPDKCGSNDKVHLIFRFQNKISKQFEEKHLKNPPTVKKIQIN